ncbi:hypothetical protein B0H11DRAFT_1249102 [Mycena galericulata]|nr:hypothetical protein B0H11DRAFT_1249102 [Mycena galericulata]
MMCQCSSRPTTSPIPQSGDICAVENISVVLPFLELIVAAMGPTAIRKAVNDRDKRRNPALNSGKPTRPCIILPHATGATANGRICLMATFEGEGPTSASFPNIYKEFIVPMFPNSANEEFGEPLHSYPEWVSKKKNQWIIGAPIFPIVGTSRDLQKWNESLEYHLCDDTVLNLVEICNKKTREWETKLTGDRFNIAAEYYRDLRVRLIIPFSTAIF